MLGCARKVLESHQEYPEWTEYRGYPTQLPLPTGAPESDVSWFRDLRVPVIGIYADLGQASPADQRTGAPAPPPRARVQVFPGYNHLFLPTQSGSHFQSMHASPGL